MAAYGALLSVMQLSVMHIIDQLKTHPKPPISMDQKQVESLTQAIISLQKFLEGYSSHGGYTEDEDVWEGRIAEAAYQAEYLIESYIVDQVLVRARNGVQNITSTELYQGVQKVIENMNLINIEIKEKMVVKDQLHIIKSVSTASRFASAAHKVTMVGFDEVLDQMLDKITGGGLTRQIIPIVGMGGIGKTTLARNIYVSPHVKESFSVCAWSVISQEYNAREILRQVLDQVDKCNRGDLSEDEFGDHLYKYLFGRKYFIVMDDMWHIEAWDRVRRFFPDNKNGSRIVVTTRLSNLASQFNYSNGLDLKFLDEDSSWDLFCKTVYREEACPLELEDVGKKIVKGCKGLPLSVAVIGGLLSKSERTKEKWGFIEKNISSIVNLDDNESCLQVLYMSYNNLPVHLKPCFLYMGRYDEDEVIPVSYHTSFLVAEGYVKPINGKCLEEIAEEYVEELADRNMLIVEERKHSGQLKSFKMHDLLRYLCLREAQKLKFLCVLGKRNIPRAVNYRHIISTLEEDEYPTPLVQSLESASLVRSFIGKYPKSLSYSFKLLRAVILEKYTAEKDIYEEILCWLVNLRFLHMNVFCHPLPSSVYFLWNLQRLTLSNIDLYFVCEIWKMPQLRHVITTGGRLDGAYCLPDSFSDEEDMVLEDLHTLQVVVNLKFGEGVLKRIPNIKTLKLYYNRKVNTPEESYSGEDPEEGSSGEDSSGEDPVEGSSGEDASGEDPEEGSSGEDSLGQDSTGEDSSEEDTSREEDEYCLNNLCCLHKLEVLQLWCNKDYSHLVHEVSFPYSLKELSLGNTNLPWEDMKTKIGSLPLLEVLKLKFNSFSGSQWETLEDQFLNLKFLLIMNCDVECWITDSTHFPRLEHLVLTNIYQLREIPTCMGDIPTLHSIKVVGCSDSVVDSAQTIKEEQQDLGNEDLQINVQ